MRWATDALGTGTTIDAATGLHDGGSPWLLDYRAGDRSGQAILRVADWDRIWGPAIATAAAGLDVARSCELPTARLIAADLDGTVAGAPSLLGTYCGASSAPHRLALPAAGAALAALHRIRIEPAAALPLRVHHTPADDHPDRRRCAQRYHHASSRQREAIVDELLVAASWLTAAKARQLLTTTLVSPLLRRADQLVRELPRPEGETVFVHGDVWLGNMLWQDESCLGLIDWKAAGVGDPGVDVSSLRMQASFTFGLSVIDDITVAWEDARQQHFRSAAYWDVVAAVNTSHDEETAARDEFLEDALARLI